MIAAKNQDVVRILTLDRIDVLIDRIRRSLIPLFRGAELGRDCENEFTAIVGEDVPTEADMTVERVGFVLSENADSLELRVDTVRESKVDDAVDSPERYGGFRTVFRERIESLTLAAGEDDRESILNDCI